jgi:hypothetical protein
VLLRAELTGPPDQKAAQLGRECHRDTMGRTRSRTLRNSSALTGLPYENQSRLSHIRDSQPSTSIDHTSGPIELVVTLLNTEMNAPAEAEANERARLHKVSFAYLVIFQRFFSGQDTRMHISHEPLSPRLKRGKKFLKFEKEVNGRIEIPNGGSSIDNLQGRFTLYINQCTFQAKING